MEELLPGLLTSKEKLDVVHQQKISTAVEALEFGSRAILDGLDKVAHEFFRGNIGDLTCSTSFEDMVADGL